MIQPPLGGMPMPAAVRCSITHPPPLICSLAHQNCSGVAYALRYTNYTLTSTSAKEKGREERKANSVVELVVFVMVAAVANQIHYCICACAHLPVTAHFTFHLTQST